MSGNNPDPFLRHEHAILGQYLATQAWIHQVDCLVISRSDLESFFGLERFKGARVKWMLSDLSKWFPFQEAFYKANAINSINSLFLSRFQISRHLESGSMTSEERVSKMNPSAPPTALLSELLGKEKMPSFENASLYLSAISTGLIDPRAKMVFAVRNRTTRSNERMHGSQYRPEFIDELTTNLECMLLNEKLGIAIRDSKTGKSIVPRNKKITKAMIKMLAEAYNSYEMKESPLKSKIDEIRDACIGRHHLNKSAQKVE